MIAVDQALFPAEPRWNGRYDYTNFLFFDDPTPLDAELDAWLSDGLPPVFVGFGSMSGRGTDRMGGIIVEAVGATGRRCIVGAGWAGLGAGALPPTWRVVKDVLTHCSSRAWQSWFTMAPFSVWCLLRWRSHNP